MKISPLDIRRQRFKKALRGYDSAEVDAFLEMLADAWEETVETREASSRELELLRAFSRIHDFSCVRAIRIMGSRNIFCIFGLPV